MCLCGQDVCYPGLQEVGGRGQSRLDKGGPWQFEVHGHSLLCPLHAEAVGSSSQQCDPHPGSRGRWTLGRVRETGRWPAGRDLRPGLARTAEGVAGTGRDGVPLHPPWPEHWAWSGEQRVRKRRHRATHVPLGTIELTNARALRAAGPARAPGRRPALSARGLASCQRPVGRRQLPLRPQQGQDAAKAGATQAVSSGRRAA